MVLDENNPNVMSYLRKSKREMALVVLNFSSQPQNIALDTTRIGASKGRVLAVTSATAATIDLSRVSIEPYGVVIAEVQKR